MFYVRVRSDCPWQTAVVAGRIFVKAEEKAVAEADMVEEIRRSELLEVREEGAKTFQEAKKLPGRKRGRGRGEEVEG